MTRTEMHAFPNRRSQEKKVTRHITRFPVSIPACSECTAVLGSQLLGSHILYLPGNICHRNRNESRLKDYTAVISTVCFVNEFQNVLSTSTFKITFPISVTARAKGCTCAATVLGHGVGIPGPFRTSTSPHSVAAPE